MKVRIKAAPAQREIDGINLEGFTPGTIREVSATTGTWLIAEGYAEPEMRKVERGEEQFYSLSSAPTVAHERRHRSR